MAGVLVHEWLEPIGGSENVLEELANLFPDAPIYCLWNDAPGRFKPDRVRESWLAKTPLRRHKSLALFFMPFVWRRLKSHTKPDWVLSSSHLFAHHAFFPRWPEVKRFAYVHSPARYIWSPELDARGRGAAARIISWALKPIDRRRAAELTGIAANSETVKARILKYWNLDSTVINPPVNISFESDQSLLEGLSVTETELISNLPKEFALGASRFVPYKRHDLVVRYGRVNSIPVVLAGTGPELGFWKSQSEKCTAGELTVIERPSSRLLKLLMRRASVLVFPAVEDFGIIPLESLSNGTPVIGPNAGGVGETIRHLETGILLDKFDDNSLIQARALIGTIRPEICKKSSLNFGRDQFDLKIQNWFDTFMRYSIAERD